MKEIPLTQGQVALVDDEDYERVAAFRWYAHYSTNTRTFYADRHILTSSGRDRTLTMARFILDAAADAQTDHISHDTLDNRRANLRICTAAENRRNRIHHRNTKSGFKGVYSQQRRWRAYIRVNGHRLYLGSFATAKEAACAYDDAARKYFGEFAFLNVKE